MREQADQGIELAQVRGGRFFQPNHGHTSPEAGPDVAGVEGRGRADADDVRPRGREQGFEVGVGRQAGGGGKFSALVRVGVASRDQRCRGMGRIGPGMAAGASVRGGRGVETPGDVAKAGQGRAICPHDEGQSVTDCVFSNNHQFKSSKTENSRSQRKP